MANFVISRPSFQAGQVMWIEKLADGVLRVDTAIGPRYIRPSFLERAYLLWTFRNFDSLPQQVLNQRQRQLIDRLCQEQVFVPMAAIGGFEQPVIGTIENRTPTEEPTTRKPMSAAPSPMPERSREAASA